MLDKELIKSKFLKSLPTYDNNAKVQTKMAQKLIDLIERKNFGKILEIGSYTGVLTKNIVQNFDFSSYLAVDIIDSSNYLKNLSPKINFLNKDIENFNTEEKFDLIISNACLQWCSNLEKTIFKLKDLSNPNSIIAFSIFSKDNLFEIKDVFNTGLNYKSKNELKEIFKKANFQDFKIYDEKITLQFENPEDVLRHLKLTGVNSISDKPLHFKEIKEKLNLLDKKYQNKITYSILYVILS